MKTLSVLAIVGEFCTEPSEGEFLRKKILGELVKQSAVKISFRNVYTISREFAQVAFDDLTKRLVFSDMNSSVSTIILETKFQEEPF